jgi:hypothetical protein
MRSARSFGRRGVLGHIGGPKILVGLAAMALLSVTAAVSTEAVSSGDATPAPSSQYWLDGSLASAPTGCDPLDPTACLLPFPDNFFTVRDRGTPTGLRVDFPVSAMPKNVEGTPIDPTAWNRNDGFSPGTPILLHIQGIDLAQTGAAPITNIGTSLRPDAPILVIDTDTFKRVPYWAELDANDPNPSEQALIIRPDAALPDGHHFIVAIRDPKNSAGQVIPPNPVFQAYRDHLPLQNAAENQRRGHFERIFRFLQGFGVDRHSLYLAWDFTVASEQNITGSLLHMRDDAFAKLGNGVPQFSVTGVTNYTTAQDPNIARHVEGTFSVPSYLNQPGGPPGSTLNLGPDGLPQQIPGNIQTANFACNIPRAAVSDATNPSATVYPGHAMLYGHGLLGTAEEINDPVIEQMANEHDFVICGTNWLGLSEDDVSTDLQIVTSLSLFPTLPDRGEQAMLDFLFLGRLMENQAGLDSSPAFQAGASHPVIQPGGLSYYGNSQGGIYGGTLTAVSQEFTRAVLGVPGMDYSLLLNRSVDFAPFLAVLNTTYPDKLTQQIGFGLIQMLWDRSDPDGYAQHMTSDPLPGTPAHEVLMDEAFGDHQVANIATENEARTIGATVHEPALAPGRSPDLVPFYGIPPTPSDVYSGSALVMWDSGSPPPPTTNTPPTAGADPHGVPRAQPTVRYQDAAFLLNGVVLNVCDESPCMAVPAGG